MPVRAAGSRARPDPLRAGQHGARVGLPHVVGDDPGEGRLQAGQGRPGEAQPRHRPEGDGLHPRRFGEDRGRHRARAARRPRVPGVPARPRRADRDASRRRGGQSPGPRQLAGGPRRRRAVRDPPPRGGLPRRQQGLGVPRRQGGRGGPGRRLRPQLDRPSARRRRAARRGVGVQEAEGRPCGGPRTRDRFRDQGPPRRCAGRGLPDGRARRDRRDRGTGRVRPRHRARRVLRLLCRGPAAR